MSKQHFETRKVTRPPNCLMCGYDLFGLFEATRCPECGVPFDLAVRKWTPARKVWVGIQVFTIAVLSIANFLILRIGPSSDPIGLAELFMKLWGLILIGGIIALVWQSSLHRVPIAMWILSVLVLGVAALALVVNGLLWVAMVASV